MIQVTAEQLDAYRADTYRLRDALRLRSREDALDYVNERGFVYFWPIKAAEFPSLWTAVAGNRSVSDKHDDPGHVTWGWKDEMLDKRQWYYAKILRGKATMIALGTVPYFYALSDNYGDPDNDFLQLYEDGLLSREAKLIYEALLREGPLNTVMLRRVIQMTGKASNSPFDRGLVSLQRDFKILPVGVAEAGAWRYSFVYDLVHRHYPDLPERARPIARGEAQAKLVHCYFDSVGAATKGAVQKLFQWRPAETERTLEKLVAHDQIVADCQVEGVKGNHYALTALLQSDPKT